MAFSELDRSLMQRALTLAARGQGHVEPNPMVGCVIARGDQVIGEGWHQRFGSDHAEVDALRAVDRDANSTSVAGATMYVTLEPCCHHGKTPPCSQAVIDAGIARVVIAAPDPFPEVAGGGIKRLVQAGIAVETGLCAKEADELNAPYLKLIRCRRPWLLAKWAMTLDGKIATVHGDSQWISGEASREIVHRLRGRVDAIMVGRGTAAADNPLLTARPPGPRTATRIVCDSAASLAVDSQLVKTARQVPLIVACSETAAKDRIAALEAAGCEMLLCHGRDAGERLSFLLDELGRRRMTNLLVEGGGALLGSLFNLQQVDEVHVFVAAKIIGGAAAPGPVAGDGISTLAQALTFRRTEYRLVGDDLYFAGRRIDEA